jgi:hypothetical protein
MTCAGVIVGGIVVVGGTVVVGTEVVAVVEEPTGVGRVVLDSAVVVVECPPKITMAVIPSAATAAMVATMIIVRFRSVDPFTGSLSGMVQIVGRTGRSALSSAVAGSF